MAKLRVNLQAGEFEVEGSEAFVERYAARIDALVERLSRAASGVEPSPPTAAVAPPIEGDFGAWLQRLPRKATDVDRMLLAGWHLQRHAPDRCFATADASRLLIEHGHKLGNPSQSVKQNQLAKRAFVVRRGRYRVAQSGLAHLAQLCGTGLPTVDAAAADGDNDLHVRDADSGSAN